MRIFTATLVTETNTFSPIPTGRRSFEQQHGRSGPIQPSVSDFAAMVAWRQRGEREGHTVIESLAAVAEPAGRTVRGVYEHLRDEILDDLQAALPVDVVLLFLHGAMVADGYDDCEGDLLRRCRALAGEAAVIGAEIDLHAHLTQEMVDNATFIVAYKEYPHTDILARAADLYQLCVDAAQGRTRPVSAVCDPAMNGLWPTGLQPMRALVDAMYAQERDGILSVSFIHGFPYGDVAQAGAKFLVVADGDRTRAQALADSFGQKLWDIRERAKLSGTGVDEALDAVAAWSANAPIVLADTADNAGGGAPGDNTFLLRRMLERNIANVVTGTYYDPIAVQTCFEAGEGARIDLRIGGKLGITSGEPLDARVTVRKLLKAHAQDSMDDSVPVPLGDCAWVHTEGIEVLLASVRSQVFAPNAFTGIGISLQNRRAVAVKSSHHFYGKFAPIASRVFYLATPGALQLDVENIPYRNRDLRFWPRIERAAGLDVAVRGNA